MVTPTHIASIQVQVSLLRNSIYWWSRGVSKRDYFDHIQWRIQRKGRGGGGSRLFLDQTEARGAENFFLLFPHPTSLSQDLDDRAHPLSDGLDVPLIYVRQLSRGTAAVT